MVWRMRDRMRNSLLLLGTRRRRVCINVVTVVDNGDAFC
jgi:hypothetical protein